MNKALRIYNLPGRAIAELRYLWPKKGQTLATGRRREHGFVHFVYSTIFYAIAGFLFSGVFGAANYEPPIQSERAYAVESESHSYEPAYASERPSEPAITEADESEYLPETDAVSMKADESKIIFQSSPVIQELPPSTETATEEAQEISE